MSGWWEGTPVLVLHWLDPSAIEHELGWSAQWDLQRGLEATYDWYAENVEVSGSSVPTTR